MNKDNENLFEPAEITKISPNIKPNVAEVNSKELTKSNYLNKITDKVKNWFNETKLLKSKPIKYTLIVAIFLILCVLLININFSSSTTEKTNVESSGYTYINSIDYSTMLENKFEHVLSKIDGVGEITVMVTLETSSTLILANSVDEKTNKTTSGTNSSSYTTTVTDPIIIDINGTSSPLVISETLPKVKGVVVVAEGIKNNVAIKINIINAVLALVDIPQNQIQVFSA